MERKGNNEVSVGEPKVEIKDEGVTAFISPRQMGRMSSISDAHSSVMSALAITDEPYVEKISRAYVVVFFVGSLPYALTQIILAATGSKVWADAAYLSAQASYGSMTISTFLQPRDAGNRRLLLAQAFLCLVLPDIVQLVAVESSTIHLVRGLFRVSIGLTLFYFGLFVRAKVAALTNKKLSRFLGIN